MNYPYSGILVQWPIIVAAIITFFIVKSYFFKTNNSKVAIDLISEQLLSKAVNDSLADIKRNNLSNNWLEKAREVSAIIDKMQKGTNSQVINKPDGIEYNFNIWQKLALGWVLVWIGITSFFIIEMILDPVIWGGNWVLLPYFFYYIIIILIYFMKG